MAAQSVDYTQLFRALGEAASGNPEPARALFSEPEAFEDWHERWQTRLAQEAIAPTERRNTMNATNPVYIPRNHHVEAALEAAIAGDMAPFDRLLGVLKTPFTVQDGAEAYALPAPTDFGPYRTFCGT
jgi:uncharacterized protein YdiU (UPF0061 family)